MATGVTDSVGNQLIGWGGVYGGQDATKVWDSVNTCVSTYGIRPNFVAVSSYISPQLLIHPLTHSKMTLSVIQGEILSPNFGQFPGTIAAP